MIESPDLQSWFNLSYASWLTLPRVLMEAMPVEWQDKMAALLVEYDDAFPNQPDIATRVQVTQNGRLIETPKWLINYRRPDAEAIDKLRESAQGIPVDKVLWAVAAGENVVRITSSCNDAGIIPPVLSAINKG